VCIDGQPAERRLGCEDKALIMDVVIEDKALGNRWMAAAKAGASAGVMGPMLEQEPLLLSWRGKGTGYAFSLRSALSIAAHVATAAP
jgi:hypothetical protein